MKIKACLYNIDSYKDRIQSETIVDILRISHDCNQCNSRHKGGFRFTIKDKEYDKCSGCGFYFKDMTDDEWENVLLMIELENSARENK